MMMHHRARDPGPRPLVPVLACGILAPLVLAAAFWGSGWTLPDATFRNATLVRDALNLWESGTLARAGKVAAIYDPMAYWAALEARFGSLGGLHTWSYPPPMLLLALPMSLLAVIPCFLVWNALGACLLWLGARAAGLSRATSLLAVLSPAALECALAGQNSLLMAALALPGFVLLDRKPVIAGALLGALILKPQLGALVPLCLLASRNWRGMAGAALSAATLATVSLAAFGWDGWSGFAAGATFLRHAFLEAPWHANASQPMLSTPFIAMRWAGAPLWLSYAIQAGTAATAMLLCWRAWRAPPGGTALARAALTLALTFFVTPYGFCYDMPALAAALLGLATQQGLHRRGERGLFAIAWIVPGFGTWLSVAQFPPLGITAAACSAALAWRATNSARRAACSR